MFCPGPRRSYSEVSDVTVPADYLWDVVADIEAMADIQAVVVGIELDNNKSAPLAIGTRFRETRVWQGSKYMLNKTITRLQATDPQERYLSFGMSFHDLGGRRTNAVETSTLTVQSITKMRSRLILTVAFEWRGARACIENFLCSCCIERKVRNLIQEEVECYCKAAIERHLAQAEIVT